MKKCKYCDLEMKEVDIDTYECHNTDCINYLNYMETCSEEEIR